MKRSAAIALVLALALLLSLGTFSQQPAKGGEKSAPATASKVYVCTMCDYASDKPGKCAKCGMNLEEVNKADLSYYCPMHPQVVSDKPGKCPKCGMDLKMKVATPKPATADASKSTKG